jgi:uncharacterized FAD-dependent dehydrogenase
VSVFVPLAELPAEPAPVKPAARAEPSQPRIDQQPSGAIASHGDRERAVYTLALLRAAAAVGIPTAQLGGGRILRKSLDARKGFPIGFQVQVEVFADHEPPPIADATHTIYRQAEKTPAPGQHSQRGKSEPWTVLHGFGRLLPPPPVPSRRHVVVVGSGPAGTFAALRLTQAGVAVTIVEQGEQVQPRRHDLAQLTRGNLVADSNYCFGEGGAGTFSDGKLYTRSKDRAAIGETLATLIEHGADPAIGVESRPHIGSNRLPKLLVALREDLMRRGVTYRFGEKVTDLVLAPNGELRGVRCASGAELCGDAVVLAVGHSARGVYEFLHRRGVRLEAKAFAIGARVEHPQPLIDRIQYGRAAEHPALPTAFYQVSTTCHDRGVYSFCMCPGGWIVPSSTEPDGLCVNGMSLSRRDSPLANSALVVTVEPRDFAAYGTGPADPLAGVAFQRAVEQAAFTAGGGGFVAPAQRLVDLLARRASTSGLRPSTYRPRVTAGDLTTVLPPFVVDPLRDALRAFDRTMPGFLCAEAQLVGVETRTSAPVRILRDASLQSPGLAGLYPSGEGAGYAGGIVSAAIDGLRIADAIVARFTTP